MHGNAVTSLSSCQVVHILSACISAACSPIGHQANASRNKLYYCLGWVASVGSVSRLQATIALHCTSRNQSVACRPKTCACCHLYSSPPGTVCALMDPTVPLPTDGSGKGATSNSRTRCIHSHCHSVAHLGGFCCCFAHIWFLVDFSVTAYQLAVVSPVAITFAGMVFCEAVPMQAAHIGI